MNIAIDWRYISYFQRISLEIHGFQGTYLEVDAQLPHGEFMFFFFNQLSRITFDHFGAPCRFIVTFGSQQKTWRCISILAILASPQTDMDSRRWKTSVSEVLDSSNSSSCLMLAFSTVKPWGGWCKWIIFWGKPMGFSRCFCMFSLGHTGYTLG